MMDPTSQLRARLMPILQRWEQELRRDNPNLTTNIYDWPVGELTTWQGHDIGIDCLFKNVAPEWPDNVALSVSLKHLDKSPSLHSADVVWGHPSGYVEASLLPTSVEFSPNHLAKVIEGLPELFTALKQAIRRGRPVA
ncbi:MAG: hypothetical protein QHD01_26385 [Bradyrhizobium sp.]|uniref:hypothetical protein n=1 Tax=Bradyrhizobium sp. TaxID=376 RepID=UPI0029AF636A|nr:hypothetical protein [Bradyrhizobium sp.]MDX3970107.1 hypothetical protein [Bradyrhizobium sp.]